MNNKKLQGRKAHKPHKPTFEEVSSALEEYVLLTKQYHETNLSNPEAIKSANKAVKKMIKIAKKLQSPENSDRFAQLLKKEDYNTHIWASRHLLEHMDPNEEEVHLAVKVIEDFITNNGAQANAEKTWLQYWKIQYNY